MKKDLKTIKRHKALRPLSIEHDHGLQLCWKIREGFNRNIETQRIKNYADWFKKNYLEPHFKMEQEYIFPALGKRNVRVRKALANHRRLMRLFNQETGVYRALNLIEEELGQFIRYEERILYNEIETEVSPYRLTEIEKQHQSIHFSDDDWQDQFWKS